MNADDAAGGLLVGDRVQRDGGLTEDSDRP